MSTSRDSGSSRGFSFSLGEKKKSNLKVFLGYVNAETCHVLNFGDERTLWREENQGKVASP